MENLQFLWQGFQVALTMPNLVSALVGAILGLIVGAVPGIGSLAGVALLLPLTFRMNPTTAIIALATLYYSNMYGGAFSAILLNIPGDSPAVMTALDGYPLARSGKAGLALSTSIVSSFIGGTLGIIILTISGPLLARWGLNFGPGELTLLIMFAMTSIGWLLGENPSTGLVATGMGLMFATVGVDMAMGLPRFDFGSVHL
ncbi:MAG: tricarboxylate transporter, partial [Firmicutes bacterium]|nr:tricarboxylate transporter [Bacillota bacterium]